MSFYTQTGKQASRQHKQGRQEEAGCPAPPFLFWVPDFPLLLLCWILFASFVKLQQSLPLGQPPFFVLFLFPLAKCPLLSKSRSLPSSLVGNWPGPRVRWRGAPQLFPSDLYHIIVLILIIIGAEPHLSNLMRVKWRHLGPEEAASWVACM